MKKSLTLALLATLFCGGVSDGYAGNEQTSNEARDRLIAVRKKFKDQGSVVASQLVDLTSVRHSKRGHAQSAIQGEYVWSDDREGHLICVQVNNGKSTYIAHQLNPKLIGMDVTNADSPTYGGNIWRDSEGMLVDPALRKAFENNPDQDAIVQVAAKDNTPGVIDRRQGLAPEDRVTWHGLRMPDWPTGWLYCATLSRDIEGTDHSDAERLTAIDCGEEVGHPKAKKAKNKKGKGKNKKETHEAKEEAHEAKEEAHEAKAEAHEAKEEVHEAKTEAHEAKEEAHEAKTEAHEAKEEAHEAKEEAHEAKEEAHDAKTDEAKEEAHEAKADGAHEEGKAEN